jgi:uncharacterized membrane protein YphA (DoxX/SURF4 family)
MGFAYSRRQKLQTFFATFPDGRTGFGLFILRIAVGVNTIVQGALLLAKSNDPVSTFWIMGLLAIVAGFLFLVGFLTPIVGSALALGYLIDTVLLFLNSDKSKHATALTPFYLALIALVLALLGPGAISVDARMFGRREILIPKRRRPPL